MMIRFKNPVLGLSFLKNMRPPFLSIDLSEHKDKKKSRNFSLKKVSKKMPILNEENVSKMIDKKNMAQNGPVKTKKYLKRFYNIKTYRKIY